MDQGWDMLTGMMIGAPVGGIAAATGAAATWPWWTVPIAGIGGVVVGGWLGSVGGLLFHDAINWAKRR